MSRPLALFLSGRAAWRGSRALGLSFGHEKSDNELGWEQAAHCALCVLCLAGQTGRAREQKIGFFFFFFFINGVSLDFDGVLLRGATVCRSLGAAASQAANSNWPLEHTSTMAAGGPSKLAASVSRFVCGPSACLATKRQSVCASGPARLWQARQLDSGKLERLTLASSMA